MKFNYGVVRMKLPHEETIKLLTLPIVMKEWVGGRRKSSIPYVDNSVGDALESIIKNLEV
jgi:hypothetical protein